MNRGALNERPFSTYRVTFSSIAHLRIELEAPSAEAAIAEAEALWTHSDAEDGRFRHFGGDCFNEPWADPVRPVLYEGDEP